MPSNQLRGWVSLCACACVRECGLCCVCVCVCVLAREREIGSRKKEEIFIHSAEAVSE